MNKKRFLRVLYIGIAVCVALLNAVAWGSTAFCDFYIARIFPIWVNLYGRITGIFPFSVGEWLLAAGVLLVILAVLLGIGAGIVAFARKLRGRETRFPRIRLFYRFCAWVLLAVFTVMTLNCTILYHASTFSEHYFGQESGEYSLEDVMRLRNFVVEQCNRLSGEMERGPEGEILYRGSGDAGELADVLSQEAIASMKKLGEQYPQLDGYYPRPKPIFFSDFMCQQYMQGWYFPFSMEANYNDVMYLPNIPATMCHELAHLRGYLYEDEANLIAYLACVNSDDPFYRYAGYLSVLNYLENDLYKARKNNSDAYQEAAAQVQPVPVETIVYEDNVFVTQEEWDRINGKAVLDTETVDAATDVFLEANLKANGVSDGIISYSRVVRLLMQYYGRNRLAIEEGR